MTDNFFSLEKETQRSILNSAAIQLNISARIIEKDIWICWTLEKLFTLPIPMAFKGGTSLSKVYNLIHRFSEDIDITIDYKELLPSIDLSKEISKSALKKLREELKEKVKEYTHNKISSFFSDCINKEFSNGRLSLELSADGEKLRIHYPTLFTEEENYLQSNVLLEFGGCNSIQPNNKHEVETMLSKVTKELKLPKAQINVLDPERTFWEKATLIHVECHRDKLNTNPERLSRHWYDLAKLSQSWVGGKALSNQKLLEDVILHKKAFFNASYANYDHCLAKKFRLVPEKNQINNLKSDFAKMQKSGMLSESPVSFDKLIEIIQKLELEMNR